MGSAHGAGHGVDDDVVQAQAGEDPLVGVAVGLVGGGQAGVVDVEGVGVLHDELAAADDAGAGAGLVAVLGLDLVDDGRQVLVGGVEVLDREGEHLLVGGGQQVVPVLAVTELKQGGAVVVPAPGGLVGLGRQEGREVDLLAAHGVHLLAHDVLDLAQRPQPQRQPGVDPGGGPADVAGAHEQAVAGDLGVGRVLAQGSDEGGGESVQHRAILRGPRAAAPTGPARPCEITGAKGHSASVSTAAREPSQCWSGRTCSPRETPDTLDPIKGFVKLSYP